MFVQVLAQHEFFGQFGSIKKISVNRSSPYSSGQSRNGPTGAAYVTFVRDEDAAACVAAIDGSVWDGKSCVMKPVSDVIVSRTLHSRMLRHN